MSQNLAWTEMDPDAVDKEGIFNDSLAAIDAGLTSQLVVSWATGTTTTTPSTAQWRRSYELRIDPAGSPPTSAETLTIITTNIAQKPFIVTNNTLGSVVVGVGGFTVSAGEKKSFYYNGTAVVQVSSARDNLLKAPVRVAHGSNVTISTALNNGDSLSGVTLATSDRVLLYGQTDPKENGIYSAGVIPTRADDADESGEILPGTLVYVRAGTNAGKLFFCTNATTPIIGTDNITWDDVGSGLVGSYLKLDGSTTMTGVFKAAAGSLGAPSITFGADSTTGWDNSGAGVIRTQSGGAEVSRVSATGVAYGTGADPTITFQIDRTGATNNRALVRGESTCDLRVQRYSNDGISPSVVLSKARGTIASPAGVNTNDVLEYTTQALDSGLTFRAVGRWRHTIQAATPSATDMESSAEILITPAASITPTVMASFRHSTGLSLFSSVVIDQNRIFRPRSYTKATLPAVPATGIIFCSDEDGGATNLNSNGSSWIRPWDNKASGTTHKKKQTIWVPASSLQSRTTNGAADGTGESTTNKVMRSTKDYDASTQEFAQIAITFPKSWDEGTITFQAYWSHAAAVTNFGVAWGVQGVALSDTDALDTAFGTGVVVTDTGGTTDTMYVTAESSAITIAGTPAAGDECILQVYREPANGSDNLAVDARLHGIKVYFLTDDDTDA